MPIINLQKRARELGRIRLGQKGDKGQPQKLDRFRFTTNSEALISKLAELYGGEPRDWDGGTQVYELISDATRIPIMVPPQPVSQWYEYWTRAGCQHRCDGRTNVLTDEPCHPEDPKHLEAIEKPTTRLNVVLRDVEGIGVWRVETHGFNAAIELPDVAEFLAQAGGYVNGWLSLEQRTSIEQTDQGPKTRHYLVPIIEVDVTPAQLMAGGGRVAAPALAGGPVGERPALAAAGPDYVALAADVETVEEVKKVWKQAQDAGHLTEGLKEHLTKRATELGATVTETAAAGEGPGEEPTPAAAPNPAPEPDADGVVEGEIVSEGDPDAVWQQIIRVGGEQGMSLNDVTEGFTAFTSGLAPFEASAGELALYLKELEQKGQAA